MHTAPLPCIELLTHEETIGKTIAGIYDLDDRTAIRFQDGSLFVTGEDTIEYYDIPRYKGILTEEETALLVEAKKEYVRRLRIEGVSEDRISRMVGE